MKKTSLSILASSLVVTGALMLSGCGGGGGDSSATEGGGSAPANSSATEGTTTQPQNERNVTVVDGYVIEATVTDCNGTSSTTNGSGIATAAFNINCPLSSQGGYIDANNNHQIDTDELQALNLHAPAGKDVISNLTELVFSGADENKLAQSLGVSVNDIYTDPIASNNITIAKAMQIAYAVEVANKTDDFVKSINNFTESNTTNNTESNTTNNNENNNEQNNLSSQSVLPPIGHYSIRVGDLPDIGNYDYDTSAGGDTSSDNNTSSNTATGSLETFANMAKELFDANSSAVTFIQAVLDFNETNASNIENALFSNKASFAAEFNMSANTNTNTSGSGSTDTNTSGSGSTDTNTSGSGSTDTNTSGSGSTDTNSSGSGSTNSNSDLPQFTY